MIINSTILHGQGVSISSQADHPPDASSILDLYTTDKGFLIPRLTSDQIQVLENPADGLMVYNTSNGKIYIYIAVNSSWKALMLGTETINPFTCGNSFFDFRDSKSYNTVLINDRCWFAENINLGTFVTKSNGQSNNQVIEKYCYEDNTSNCITYGGLYTWGEAMGYATTEGSVGICPPGWHIPTDLEWFEMESYLDNTITTLQVTGLRGTDCGGKLKETGTTYWNSPNTGADNSSGFSARGGGRHSLVTSPVYVNSFFDWKNYGFFWTSSYIWDPFYQGPLNRYLYYNSALSGRGYNNLNQSTEAYSLRCIKDL